MYVPNLVPYPGYTPIQTESIDDAAYEELPGGEHICPERQANIFSSISIKLNAQHLVNLQRF